MSHYGSWSCWWWIRCWSCLSKKKKIGEIINEKIDELKEDIKNKLNEEKDSIIESLQQKATETGNNLKTNITNFIGGLVGDFGKITPPTEDEMSDRNGRDFCTTRLSIRD